MKVKASLLHPPGQQWIGNNNPKHKSLLQMHLNYASCNWLWKHQEQSLPETSRVTFAASLLTSVILLQMELIW